jgi:S1-C subfamily serine protease
LSRFILFLFAMLAFALPAAPARADDISVAGRSVVRVVVISFGEDGEVTGFGHGSGFAVAPNRIVTNAHVVAQAQQAAQEGRTVSIGVVPSQGAQAGRARVVAIDPARDLALLEVEGANLPAIPLYVGPLDDGAPIAALGYPGNVDLATARSADDYIQPLPPTRSVGIFSNVRPINGITTLLHTANIARGHSGGPLLDQCGRVLGVNTLITRNQDGDAPFAFAVSNRELTAFLGQARQP